MKNFYIKGLLGLLLLLLSVNGAWAAITLKTKDVTSCNKADGEVTITVTGAPGDYEYALNGGAYQASNKFKNLPGGNHSISVRDKKTQCEYFKNFVIKDQNKLKISISGFGTTQFCEDDAPPTVTLTASVSGGSGEYDFSWPGGSLTVLSSGYYSVTVTDKKTGCTKSQGGRVVMIPIVCSKDPNDILGPEGYGPDKMVSKFAAQPYLIRFENDPNFATAPAQVVKITQTLDKTVNPLSFRLGDFGFGKFNFTVPVNKTYYSTRLNVMDSLGVVVDITAGIDVVKKEAFWVFESKDPLTGLPPANANLGFLLVNNAAGVGEGYVRYTVKPADNTVTGDTIHAKASIVFDVNAAIATPPIFNTVDAVPPVSKIKALPTKTQDTSILVKWTGKDDVKGSGKRDYTLFVSEDGGVFKPYQTGLTDSSTTFNGNAKSTYRYFTLATDNVGIQEPMKNIGEITITLGTTPAIEAPINLTAEAKSKNQIDLNWTDKAANETNIVVERSLTPDVNFAAIATLPANSTNYADKGLNAKTTYYYRVKGTNATDASDYSAEASATTADKVTNVPDEIDEKSVKLYPNPVLNKFMLEYSSPQKSGQITLVLYSTEGKVVKQLKVSSPSGDYKESMDISNLAAGVYILRVLDQDMILAKRLVKK